MMARKPRIIRRSTRLLFTYVMPVVFIVGGFWLWREVGGHGAEPAPLVRIPKGSSMSAAADSLANAGVIGSRRLFRLFAATTGRSRAIKPGTYEFAKHTSCG